jgi:hypothetical protein
MRSLSIPWLLRGSLICFRRKCGKPNCRCVRGKPHASPALSYSQRGKTRILTLPLAQVPQVRAALKRYHQGLRRLQRQADAGLRQLARLLHQARKSTPSR